MIWTQCPCESEVNAAELIVRITSAPPSLDPSSLGFSYVDVLERRGTLATVFANRVRALAASAGADDGVLLGRAIAHEIAHLLLGTRDHAKTGLMRGRWTSIELVRNRPDDWQLSTDDSARLRHAALRRLNGPASPAMAVAERASKGEALATP